MPPRQLLRTDFSGDRPPRLRRLVAALIAVPGLVPAVSYAQLAGAAAEPQRIDAPWGLQFAPQLEEHRNAPGSAPSTFVLGEHASGTADRDIAVKGAAELRRDASLIKADALHYDEDTDMADAYGNVRIVSDNVLFAGPEAHLHVDANAGYMPAPKYRFTVRGGSGSAKRVELIDAQRSVFTDATYTACQCAKDPAWYIRGSEFDFDTGADEGVAHNGVLFFQGLPIFASPWLSFPLSGDRRSGLLPPMFSMNSTNGFEFSQPYYFNIAPNRDLTLTPRIISKRGVQMQASFRYLEPTYAGSLTAEYLPNDALKHENRYAVYWQHNQALGGGFAAYVNYNRVSDNTYPQDLASAGNQFLVGTQVVYQQEAGITYNRGPWSVLAREQHWQSLDAASTPYGREPQLNVRYRKYDVGGFDYGAEADATRFHITTGDATQGNRVVFNPYISYGGLQGPGYFAVPKVQLHVAAYNLTNVASTAPAGQPKNFTESIPTFSVDSGLIFERSVRVFGKDYIQTLEPRLYYVYTPYRNQDFAPLFDTAESDFGLAEIFTPNTFVGNDRIADANRLTAGLTTRFIDPATGDERARFLLAQEYYFRGQRVTLEPGATPSAASHSDLIAGASIKLGAGFASETAFQYNADDNQLVRSSIGFGFSPEERKVINVAYRYTRKSATLGNDPINQILVSGEWPITQRIYGVGRFNYDLTGHRVVDALVGFQYDADCWTLGVGLQRYANGVTSTNESSSDTRVLAQLTLKGLSNVDNGLAAAFRAGVAGYTPPPAAPLPLSRFSDYQ